jgi:spore germination protein KB
MRNEKIANRQLWFIIFIVHSTILLSFLPCLTSADALQDAWLSCLLSLAGSMVFVLLISLLSIKFPDMTVIEYSQLLLGRWLGKLLGLVFIWLFLERAVLDLQIYGNLLETGFLPNTPLIFLIGTMVLVCIICVYQGIEILGRMADFLFFVFLIAIIDIIIISLRDIDLNNLQPVMARGWAPVVRGAWSPLAIISHAWILGMLTPLTIEPKKLVRTILTAVGVSSIALSMVVFITIGVLSPREGARSTFPLLTLMRSIQVTEFLERMEILLVFAWGLGLFITVTIYFYSGIKGLSQILNLKDHQLLLWPVGVIIIFLSIHGFEDIFSLYNYLKPASFAPYSIGLLVLTLGLLWLGYGLRKLMKKSGRTR